MKILFSIILILVWILLLLLVLFNVQSDGWTIVLVVGLVGALWLGIEVCRAKEMPGDFDEPYYHKFFKK